MRFLLTALKIFYILDPALATLPEPKEDDTTDVVAKKKKREEDDVGVIFQMPYLIGYMTFTPTLIPEGRFRRLLYQKSSLFLNTLISNFSYDTLKPGRPYTQIPYCDPPKSEGLVDKSSTYGIFVVSFLYIFLTNIQILIIFYKSLMYNSFTLLHANIY